MAVTNLDNLDAQFTHTMHLPFEFFQQNELCPALHQDDAEFELVLSNQHQPDISDMNLRAQFKSDLLLSEIDVVDPIRSTNNYETAEEIDKELPPMPDIEFPDFNEPIRNTETQEMELLNVQDTPIPMPMKSLQTGVETSEWKPNSEILHKSTSSSSEATNHSQKVPRKRIKMMKVDDSHSLQINAKKYKKWMESCSDWTTTRPKKKQKGWSQEKLLMPCYPGKSHASQSTLMFMTYRNLITSNLKAQETKQTIPNGQLAAESESPFQYPLPIGDNAACDVHLMEIPEREELMTAEPLVRNGSHEFNSMPSQIDKLRAALSSSVTYNPDFGKTPGSSVKPSKLSFYSLIETAKVDAVEVNDGSDLSSLANRLTNQRETPNTGGLSLSQTYNSEQPLLPILEEDHHNEQEHRDINFLPETQFSQPYIMREEAEGERPSNQVELHFAFSTSTLSIIECLKQRLEEDSENQECITFFQLSEGLNRLEIAKLFYQICMIHSHDYIRIHQAASYSDIIISKGKNM